MSSKKSRGRRRGGKRPARERSAGGVVVRGEEVVVIVPTRRASDGSRVLANFSRSYAALIQSAGQSAGIAFLVIFYFAGTYLGKAAAEIGLHLVRWIRGY